MHVIRNLSLCLAMGLTGMSLGAGSPQSAGGEVLYNGIVLPAVWPPEVPATRKPMPVPYLAQPPDVISIDVGRQLFVDDFLIYQTSLTRTYYQAEYIRENPVLKADRPEELGMAMPFSDGVWYDPQDKQFKLWYFMAGFENGGVGYASSTDGVHWVKPDLDVVSNTSYVLKAPRDSVTVWLDQEDKDPARRYKLFRSCSEKGWRLGIYFSADGIHWGEPAIWTGPCGDRTTAFYNPFRKKWVFSLRGGTPFMGRCRFYRECDDLLTGAKWEKDTMLSDPAVLAAGRPTYWCGVDELDPPRHHAIAPQLYNLDAVAYESLMLGFFSIWHGQPGETRPKPCDVTLGFSRDGFHWDRPDRRAFYGLSDNPADWNWGNVQSAGGGCLVVGDKLYFYCSGRKEGADSTGLAVLRRDGFASMNATGDAEQVLVTRKVRFTGQYLFVNADCPQGHLIAEVLDEYGNVIGEFSRGTCMAYTGDSTCARLVWVGKSGGSLAALAGKPVRFRFTLRNGKLYSFWVSPDKTGASRGYVAAGGPNFTGPTDTVGMSGE